MDTQITSGYSQIPNGWGAFIFAICLSIVGFILSIYWKAKVEKLERKIRRLKHAV